MLLAPYAAAGAWAGLDLGRWSHGAVPMAAQIGFSCAPWSYMALRVAISRLPPSLGEAAAAAGMGALARIARVWTPLLAAPLIGAALFAVARAFGDYGTAERNGARTFGVAFHDMWNGAQSAQVAALIALAAAVPALVAVWVASARAGRHPPRQFAGAAGGALIGHYMDKQEAELKKVKGANVQREGDKLIVRFNSAILFDTGKSKLKPASEKDLTEFAGVLKQYPDTNIVVEGHTDNVGAEDYNSCKSGCAAMRCSAASTFLPAAISSSTTPRRSPSSTSTRAASSAAAARTPAAGSRTRSRRTTSKRSRKSCARSGCAISAASSCSTSSTWRRRRTV